MKTQNPEITIIIVNWNGIRFLPDCLKSIVENPPSVSYKIILVDNDSSDKSVEWLKSNKASNLLKNTDFVLIESKENLGFGKGNNLAIQQTNSPFIFLLNPDTIVKSKAIDSLLGTLKSDEKIGVCAPKLLNEDGSLQQSVWVSPTPINMVFENIFYRVVPNFFLKNWLYGAHWDYSDKRSVPIICGAAMLIKKTVIDEVGAFDEDFHMYAEDLEFSARIANNNWLIYFVPESQIYHLSGQSSVQRWTALEKRITMEKGFILFQKKSLSSVLFVSNLFTRTFVFFVYYLRNIFDNVESKKYKWLMKLQLMAIKDLIIPLD